MCALPAEWTTAGSIPGASIAIVASRRVVVGCVCYHPRHGGQDRGGTTPLSRAFLICPEPVATLTAGVGTRFVTLARVLAGAGHTVTLAIPNDPAEASPPPAGVQLLQAVPDQLGAQAADHDWVLLHGHLGNHYLCQRDDLPVVVDLYDPFLIENLHYHHELGFAPFRTDHATWRLQMTQGDLFLCSSPEQRLYYLGWLTALGRVNPLALEHDPALAKLIVEVPFGTPDEAPPPRRTRAELLPGIDEDAPVLYFGGLYDWYDPGVALAALPRLLARDPRTVLVFVDHPHRDLMPGSVAGRTRLEAERRGWLGNQVRFEPWRPFDDRFALAQAADLALVTHVPGLEADLSLRTRLVDLLWLGLPVIATAGGTMARVVAERCAGAVVPAGDPAALAAAAGRLLDDPAGRERAAAGGRDWARERTWQRVTAPLLRFAAAPWRDPHRARFTALAPPAQDAIEPLVRRLRRRLRRLGIGR